MCNKHMGRDFEGLKPGKKELENGFSQLGSSQVGIMPLSKFRQDRLGFSYNMGQLFFLPRA